MTVVPLVPAPAPDPRRRDALLLVAASLAIAACLGGYMLLQDLAAPDPARPLPVQLNGAQQSAVFPEDHWAWPGTLGPTAGMFQCWPGPARDTDASVMVWTDKVDTVVAVGPVREGGLLPAYATVLAGAPAADASLPVHVASQGHAVRTVGKRSTLQLKDMRLDCVRTWDD